MATFPVDEGGADFDEGGGGTAFAHGSIFVDPTDVGLLGVVGLALFFEFCNEQPQ